MSETEPGTGAERSGVRPAALSFDAAAAYLGGVSRSWLEHSDVPRVRLGRRVVFRIVDLDAYLANRNDLDVAS